MTSSESSASLAVKHMNSLRPVLFDYCVRMTGDLIASSGIVSKVCQGFEASHSEAHDGVPTDIQLALFRECRVLGGNAWDADTSFLQNPGLDSEKLQVGSLSAAIPGGTNNSAELWRLYHLLRSLPGRRREALLLVERYDFSPLQAADITGLSATEFDRELAAAWQALLTNLPPGAVPVAKAGIPGPIKAIPLFNDPVVAECEPVTNLSEIMDELNTARRFAGMGWVGWFWLLAAGAALAWYFL